MSPPGDDAGGDAATRFATALFAAARRARCRDAELYIKKVRARQVTLEPPAEADGMPQRILTEHAERGLALRILDAEGREGFAWRGGGLETAATGESAEMGRGAETGPGADTAGGFEGLLRDALASARVGGRAGAPWPAGPEAGDPIDGLADPAALMRPEEVLAAMARAAVTEVAARAGGALDIDRVVVTEARTSTRIVRLAGAGARYERSLAGMTVAVVPAVPEADAVVEERSACRLDDLDARAVAGDAVHRALPRRPASVPEALGAASPRAEASHDRRPIAVPASIVLAPRAAASLWAAFVPLFDAGWLASSRPVALDVIADARAPGRPSSAPFDGAGRPSERRILVDSGRSVARIDAAAGPFVRVSYRDLPAPGAAALVIAPGRSVGTGAGDSTARFTLRAAVIDVRPGPTLWSIEIRRGDWCQAEGATLGAADGLTWEGPPGAIVQAVVATLDDTTWFEVGLPMATPSVVLDGLGPWRLPESTD